ncbi:MAG TPA: zinc-binding alcohol dehydrogenase family protein [Burkholderiales bacterium]|nr:zinc-binding alcohol dehydrogenase family protein [Burkholderiales bacterium]
MKAVAHTGPDIAALVDIELPKPAPGPRDLLVKVEAISVNPVDTKQRKTDVAAPRVLGWDAAGTVAAIGAQVTLFKPGDAVYYAGDVTRPGCDSEFHLVDERIVGRKPKSLDFAHAAAVPLTAITAWESYFDRMKVARGKSLLIINGAGGVGSIGIQIARLAGLKVIATASRPETIAWVKELGAEQVADHRKPLRPQLEALGLKHVDYIANFSGELDSHWPAMADLVAPQGAVLAIVGNRDPLAMDVVRSKSATVCWELMFTRPRFQTPDMLEQHKLLNQIAEWLDAGKLRSTLRETLSPINAANLRKAHQRLESGKMIGKLVLQGWA